MKAHIVSLATIIVDLRTSAEDSTEQAVIAHRVANQHFFGNEEGIVKEAGGTFFGTNMIEKYHMASVAAGLWIVSTKTMVPSQTRPIAKKFVAKNPIKG